LELHERRRYQRQSHLFCEARASRDQASWAPVRVGDVSSGGMRVYTDDTYFVGDEMWVDLTLYGAHSEFHVKTPCVVRRDLQSEYFHAYGLEFVGLSPHAKVRIDEMIRQMRPRELAM
jgi:c-di-GMP-binding flagellar brake protein YcgR